MKQSWNLAELAERWGISHSSVLGLVYSGDLRAIDVSTNPKGKSRYIVPADSLADFEAARTTAPPEPPEKRKRVRVRGGEVIEFFT